MKDKFYRIRVTHNRNPLLMLWNLGQSYTTLIFNQEDADMTKANSISIREGELRLQLYSIFFFKKESMYMT